MTHEEFVQRLVDILMRYEDIDKGDSEAREDAHWDAYDELRSAIEDEGDKLGITISYVYREAPDGYDKVVHCAYCYGTSIEYVGQHASTFLFKCRECSLEFTDAEIRWPGEVTDE